MIRAFILRQRRRRCVHVWVEDGDRCLTGCTAEAYPVVDEWSRRCAAIGAEIPPLIGQGLSWQNRENPHGVVVLADKLSPTVYRMRPALYQQTNSHGHGKPRKKPKADGSSSPAMLLSLEFTLAPFRRDPPSSRPLNREASVCLRLYRGRSGAPFPHSAARRAEQLQRRSTTRQ